jgi:hypothetical protein
VGKITNLLEEDGITYRLATEDIKILSVCDDGAAEVEAYYIGRLYKGMVAKKEAREIPGYLDEEPLNKFLNQPLTEAEIKAEIERKRVLREEFGIPE